MGRPKLRTFIALTLFCCIACGVVWAQGSTAQINGTVRDTSGLAIPGAAVRVTQTATSAARTVTSGSDGSYILPNLPLGPYQLEVSKEGFTKYVQSGIVLQVDANPTIDVSLKVGSVSEQVLVEANAALVETRSSVVGEVIENERILELPLNGRNVTDLITLAGASVQTATSPDRLFGGTPYIAVAGGMQFAVEYTLDGANHINFVTGVSMPMPFPDALQEFKVETSGVNSQSGSSAAVGAVTKSGTNELHGDVFEFIRNDLFNARQYFATTNSTLKRNQFGATLGGPIMKNKLFFFGAFQGTIIRQDPANLQAFVPTASMLAGDWTAFTSPACNAGRQITLRAPFSGNRISPSVYSAPALAIAAKLPQTSDPCGLVTYGRGAPENDKQPVARGDYQLSAQHSIFARYMATSVRKPSAFLTTPDNLLNTPAEGYDNLAQSATVGDTYLFGANIVNSFRYAENWISIWRQGQQFFTACSVGINIYCGYSPNRMTLSVTGGFALGSGSSPDDNRYHPHIHQLNDDVSLIRGTHQFAFGGNYVRATFREITHFVDAGTMTFNGQVSGNGMADFFLGNLNTFLQGTPNNHALTQNYFALYLADVWRLRPRLTVNYGLRWEPFFPQVMSNGAAYNFDMNRFLQGTKSTVYTGAPAGLYYPGDAGFPDTSGLYTQWGDFSEHVGLAWDVTGNGRTSVRASFAKTHDFVNADWREDASGAPPWGERISLTGLNLQNPWSGFPGGNPFPVPPLSSTTAVFTPYGAFLTPPYDIKIPYTMTWNASLQRQVSTDWLLSASYIGTRTVHLWTQRALNPAVYMPGASCTINGATFTPCSSTANTNQRRALSLLRPQDGRYFGITALYDDGGLMDYHGMLLSVQRRASRGVTVSANYTLSHCIGDYADLQSMGPAADETYTNPNNRRADRANCDNDRRHIFNLTSVAEAPRFANAAARLLASDWKLAGIYRWSSGSPLNVTTGTDNALNGILMQRPNQVLLNPYGSSGPLANYLNPAAFAAPATGTIGNLGRNAVVGPATWSFDLSLSRAFAVMERRRLEIRVEAYNVTNSFRPLLANSGLSATVSPGTALSSNTFGQIRNSGDPRIMQFAAKFVF